MPSIFFSKDLGDNWSEWIRRVNKLRLPDELSSEDVYIMLGASDGDEFCYLLEPSTLKMSWSSWNDSDWDNWQDPFTLSSEPPLDDDELLFSGFFMEGFPYIAAISPREKVLYWLSIDEDGDWEGPFSFTEPPNWSEESGSLFLASDEDVLWLVSVNLDEQSIYFSDWDGDEFSEWSQLNDLDLPDEWLELGVQFDGSLEDDRLVLYAIVHDDDYYEEEEEEVDEEFE